MTRVLSAAMFFPRGGSASVIRALARRLPDHGWDTCVVAGSLPGHGDAEHFYTGVDVHPVIFEPQGTMPMHPSYEGERAFAALGDDELERHVAAWAEHFAAAGAADADVLHLHHLTPLHEAARRVAPGVPVVTHIHGTELLMLERIAEDRPAAWEHADAWAARMRAWAQDSARIVVSARTQLPRVEGLLGVEHNRCVVLPNGVDLRLFDRVDVDRREHWQHVLAEAPQGWLPGGDEGSIGYTREEADRVAQHTVVLYVGRFTEVKRLRLLVEAWCEAEQRFDAPASLVIVGGHPGEWEDEHPADTIARTGAAHVHLAGWHEQEELPPFLGASDLLVMPSVREQFGMVITEAMSCGLPPIAVGAYGPKEIVDDGKTGWLVAPDDRAALRDAIVDAVNDPAERARRGAAARAVARRRYDWDVLAGRLACVLDEVRAATPATAVALRA